MKWFKKLITKDRKTTISEDLSNEGWEHHKAVLTPYQAHNRLNEPIWMLQIRQDTLTIEQIIKVIDSTPKDELLKPNANNETLLSLLIESEDKLLVIEHLINKYPESYNQNFKVKGIKSYVDYCLYKYNVEVFNFFIKKGWIHQDNEETSVFFQQIHRFVQNNECIVVESIKNVSGGVNQIPFEVIMSLFSNNDNNYQNIKFIFTKPYQEALLYLIEQDYFKDKELNKVHDFFYELLNNTPEYLFNPPPQLSLIYESLIKKQIAVKVDYIDQVINNKLSDFNKQLYLSKLKQSPQDLGLKNKLLLRHLNEKIVFDFQNFKIVDYNLVNTLTQFISTDQQLLVPLIDNWDRNSELSKSLESINWNIEPLIKSYSTQRVISLLINEIKNFSVKQYEFVDMFRSLNSIIVTCTNQGLNLENYLPEKPTSFHEIHEKAWREASKLKQINILLHPYYPESLFNLHGQKIGIFNIEIPQDSHRLIEVGQKLSICVGGGFYRDSIVNKESFIVLLIESNDIKYCIEISKQFQIKQFRGFQNSLHENSTLCYDFKKLLGIIL